MRADDLFVLLRLATCLAAARFLSGNSDKSTPCFCFLNPLPILISHWCIAVVGVISGFFDLSSFLKHMHGWVAIGIRLPHLFFSTARCSKQKFLQFIDYYVWTVWMTGDATTLRLRVLIFDRPFFWRLMRGYEHATDDACEADRAAECRIHCL